MFEYDHRGERATRDIVSRAVMDRIRKGHTSPNGGVWISMGHLGPDNVRRQFKGMVERCADCGFDLAAGRVEVIPTAHYMMGGVMFAPDCTTEIRGLYAAGEDTGGVHGANRLGGNGVANSTVFGGLAGVSMATALRKVEKLADPDTAALDAARQRAFEPLGRRPGDLDAIRRKLYRDVGRYRRAAPAESLTRARSSLNALAAAVSSMGVGSTEPRYNLDLDDRLNLENLISDQPRNLCCGGNAHRFTRRTFPGRPP